MKMHERGALIQEKNNQRPDVDNRGKKYSKRLKALGGGAKKTASRQTAAEVSRRRTAPHYQRVARRICRQHPS